MAQSDAPDCATPGIERVLRRDRWVVGIALGLVTVLAWVWLLRTGAASRMDAGMADMAGMDMAPAPIAFSTYVESAFVMWLLMMIAMMLPSAAPMILIYARFARKARGEGGVFVSTAAFLACYIAVWAGFSLLAALVQAVLVSGGQVSRAMLSLNDHRAAGGVLLAAGIYNLTPLKRACLDGCRSPFAFLSRHWRGTGAGVVRLGLLHGLYCLGCCWLLMALLFVSGIMNLAWVGLIAAMVAAEKLLPWGNRIGVAMGIAMAAAGLVLIAI